MTQAQLQVPLSSLSVSSPMALTREPDVDSMMDEMKRKFSQKMDDYMKECTRDCLSNFARKCPDVTPDNKCVDGKPVVYTHTHNWAWLGYLILWLIVFTVIFWLIYFSLKPAWVLKPNTNEVDTGRVLLAAIVSAIILVIIIWIVKALAFGGWKY